LGAVTATAPSRDLTDNKKKRREGSSRGSCSRRPRTRERKPGKRKGATQVEYRVEGAQDRRRRRKPGGWKAKHTKTGGRRTELQLLRQERQA